MKTQTVFVQTDLIRGSLSFSLLSGGRRDSGGRGTTIAVWGGPRWYTGDTLLDSITQVLHRGDSWDWLLWSCSFASPQMCPGPTVWTETEGQILPTLPMIHQWSAVASARVLKSCSHHLTLHFLQHRHRGQYVLHLCPPAATRPSVCCVCEESKMFQWGNLMDIKLIWEAAYFLFLSLMYSSVW